MSARGGLARIDSAHPRRAGVGPLNPGARKGARKVPGTGSAWFRETIGVFGSRLFCEALTPITAFYISFIYRTSGKRRRAGIRDKLDYTPNRNSLQSPTTF